MISFVIMACSYIYYIASSLGGGGGISPSLPPPYETLECVFCSPWQDCLLDSTVSYLVIVPLGSVEYHLIQKHNEYYTREKLA